VPVRGSAARRADLDPTGAGLEATRDELLDAAASLFAERGFDRTTVDDVVAGARVAKGTVYWYYRSKKALFLAVLERAAKVYRDELVRAAGRARSPMERLECAIEGTMSFARSRPDLCRLYFQQVHDDDADFAERRAAIYTSLIDDLKATIGEAIRAGEARPVDVPLAARVIVGAVEAGVGHILDEGRRGRSAVADELRSFVTGGLRSEAR
jgi:AcrR family transcriptional regulator